MHYRFNRKTYLTPEDLSISFSESIEAIEIAKLHLKEEYIEQWLTETKDYDTLIFLKKQKEAYHDDHELILFELLFYLNPTLEFGILQFNNLEIYSLKSYIGEWYVTGTKTQEIGYILSKLYNGRLSIFYKIYSKHTKKRDDITEKAFNFFTKNNFFNSITSSSIYSSIYYKATLKAIDYFMSPNKYSKFGCGFIYYKNHLYIPTVEDVKVLHKYLPPTFQNAIDSLGLSTQPKGPFLNKNERSLILGLGAYIENFLLRYISYRITNFDHETWAEQISDFLNEGAFTIKEGLKKEGLPNTFFQLKGKWGVLGMRYNLIAQESFLNIVEFHTAKERKLFFQGIEDSNSSTIFDYSGNTLFKCSLSNSEQSHICIEPFNIEGKSAIGVFNKEHKRVYPFDEVFEPREGIAIVKTGGKFNYINDNGKILLDTWVEDAADFYNGFACVKIDKEWCFSNDKGHLIRILTRDEVKNKESVVGKPIAKFQKISTNVVKEGNFHNSFSFDGKNLLKVFINKDYLLTLALTSTQRIVVEKELNYYNPEIFNLRSLLKTNISFGEFELIKEGAFYFLNKDGKKYLPETKSALSLTQLLS